MFSVLMEVVVIPLCTFEAGQLVTFVYVPDGLIELTTAKLSIRVLVEHLLCAWHWSRH